MPCPTADVPSPRRFLRIPPYRSRGLPRRSFAVPSSKAPVRAGAREAPGFSCNSSNYSLEADERGRTVRAIHHQVFDMPFSPAMSPVKCFRDGPRGVILGRSRALAIRLLVHFALMAESSVRDSFHTPPPGFVRAGRADTSSLSSRARNPLAEQRGNRCRRA